MADVRLIEVTHPAVSCPALTPEGCGAAAAALRGLEGALAEAGGGDGRLTLTASLIRRQGHRFLFMAEVDGLTDPEVEDRFAAAFSALEHKTVVVTAGGEDLEAAAAALEARAAAGA